MADKGPGSTASSGKKRLARAKIKPTDNGIKSSKGRVQEREERTKAAQKQERKQRLTRIAIGVFAVIMALSMMLPSLSYIFGSNSQQQAEDEPAASSSSDTSEASSDEGTSTQLTGIELVDSNYKAVVDPLEAKLADNKDDLATLLNLGNDYLSWANEASSYASDDESSAHVAELYQGALDYYDQYLALNDSNAVRVNRAMAQLYSGDLEGATTALEELTKSASDYGPAWANLGMVYEYQGRSDAAKEAYQSAVEADPNDEYGSKSYANRRLAAMAASQNGGEISEDMNTSVDISSGGASALEDALGAGN